MTDMPAREGDRCPECGTPMEPVELSGEPVAPGEVVFRCANGHERRVHRTPETAPGELPPAGI